MDTLEIEDRHLGGNNLEAYYSELPQFRALAIDPQIAPERRRVWEMVAHGMQHVPEEARRLCGTSGPKGTGFIFFGPEGPEIVERPGADPLAVRAIVEVIEELAPDWVEAVEQARFVADAPEVIAAWSEVPIEAVFAVTRGSETPR